MCNRDTKTSLIPLTARDINLYKANVSHIALQLLMKALFMSEQVFDNTIDKLSKDV